MKIKNISKTGFQAGSHLQGHFTATYNELVKVFGEPSYKGEEQGGFDKVWTEWELSFDTDEGEVYATIYDWKEDSPNASRTGPYRWHIGGFDWKAEDAVGTAFNQEMSHA